MKENIEQTKEIKRQFAKEYGPKVEELGYFLGHGISKVGLRDKNTPKSELEKTCIVAYLQPKENSPDPINEDLLERIRNTLPKEYKGIPIIVEYLGIVRPLVGI